LVSGQRHDRLWDHGIVTSGILQLTVLSFATVNSPEQPIKKITLFSITPESLQAPPADQEA